MNQRTIDLVEHLDEMLWHLHSEIDFVCDIIGTDAHRVLEFEAGAMLVVTNQVAIQLQVARNITRQVMEAMREEARARHKKR